jgi:hypothetical protein
MFTKSDSIQNLAAALAKAQADFPAVPFNAVNPFLKNRYADLGAVIETARPVLAKNGLAFTQMVNSEAEYIGVTTVLMHSSGEFLSSNVLLPLSEERGKSQAQVAGSVVTYLRRYALASMLGLYADEDADGQPVPKQITNVSRPTPAATAPTFVKNDAPAAANVSRPTNGNGHEMTVEEAEAIVNSKGVPYGAIDTEKLSHMVNAMVKDGDPAHDIKIKAARMIMAARGEGRKVQQAA